MGDYDRQRGRGSINVPLGEMMSARLAMFYEERDGYLERQRIIPNFSTSNIPTNATNANKTLVDMSDSDDPFDLDNFGLRGKLRFQPSETFDFVLGYNYFKEGGNGPQADIVPSRPSRVRSRPVPTFLFRPAPPPGWVSPAAAGS